MYRRETPWDIVKPLLFFLGSILWLEGIYRAFYVRPFFDVGLVYILLFSLPLAGMCALLTSLWGKKGNRKAGFAVLGVLTLWYMIQSVYHTIFATVLVTKSFNMAGQSLGSYWKETLLGIWEALPALLLLAVPLVVYFFQPRFALLNRPDGRVLLGVIGGVIGIASIVFAMAVVVFSGVSVKLTGTALELSGGIGDRASIPYTEITGVEWRDVFDKGSRTWGTGTGKISSGTFTNDEFGAYRLYLHNRVRCAVVVRHGADETTVFNGETEEKTKEVYEELASRAKI